MERIKIGVICPHRNDRPDFLEQFKKYIACQTVQPDVVEYVDYEPESADIDVTQRYRRGCEKLFRRYSGNCDVVLFMEVDDFYSPEYIETMVTQWIRAGKPEIFGIGETIYYHIFGKRWVVIPHKKRASAMSSMVTRSILNMPWPRDNNPYLDVEMWEKMRGKTFIQRTPICLGIKHGIGMVGGGAHDAGNAHYNRYDEGGLWLREIVGIDNYKFYESLKMQNV